MRPGEAHLCARADLGGAFAHRGLWGFDQPIDTGDGISVARNLGGVGPLRPGLFAAGRTSGNDRNVIEIAVSVNVPRIVVPIVATGNFDRMPGGKV